ncbi:hypothetical protein ACFW4K_17125 [Nocardiopsis alba]|uniref:hypothetical protein n=1 Tax=Nocardiopsis alba TaxID=53437 RepID=UPI00366B46E1
MSDPVTLSIATAVATGVATKLGEGANVLLGKLAQALTRRFARDPEAQSALVSARFEGPEQPQAIEVVAERLERAEEEDPEIRELVGRLRAEATRESDDSVSNVIEGNVSGDARVIMGRDFNGDIRL